MRPFKFFGENIRLSVNDDFSTRLEYQQGWVASIEGTGSPYDYGTRSHQIWSLGFNDQMDRWNEQAIEAHNYELTRVNQ